MPSTNSQIAKLLEPAPPIETLIADGFNEELGNSENTTLLPLDLQTLEFLCRLYLPGVPLGRLFVNGSFLEKPFGFQQIVKFSCGSGFHPFQITITQCTSHVDAIKAMKQALCNTTCVYNEDDYEAKNEKNIGNYAVKSMEDTFIIWTRWTTVIELSSPDVPDRFYEPPIEILALAAHIDGALKAHKGIISQVPKPGLDYDSGFTMPFFDNVHETHKVEVEFNEGIHLVREYRVIQNEKACVVKSDVTSTYDNKGNTRGRFRSNLEITFHKEDVPTTFMFLLAHEASLWPGWEKIDLDDLVNPG
ncbi:hypothetical protein B0T20DRAFT_483418 [Sordaria brevicollis]|uniref:Uncharacterized protein n=1 Tax=Sordaria brevicollis TaxID=83679 RepID=A0AAE0P1D8_SORBR|nr:hypothetical protein B0T20DRAFT_483418 [Sordaria brevicollis]